MIHDEDFSHSFDGKKAKKKSIRDQVKALVTLRYQHRKTIRINFSFISSHTR